MRWGATNTGFFFLLLVTLLLCRVAAVKLCLSVVPQRVVVVRLSRSGWDETDNHVVEYSE